MIQRLDATTDTFLTDLASIKQRIARAQREVVSGRRINQVSDAPADLGMLMQLRTDLGQTVQIRSNLSRVQSEVDTAEQSLQSAVAVLERAGVLGIQGANGTMTTQQRAIVGEEVESLLQQMVGLSRARVETRYVFSGDADGQGPFTLDLALEDPVSNYLGAPATRQAMHPTGAVFRISKTGEEIFDNPDPAKNVFQAINNLRLSLRADDSAGIEAALDQIRSAQTHLNSELASYGAVQNQVAEATNFAHKQELRLKTRISELVDADMTEAILALNQSTYQQEVALSTKAKNRQISLFDFIG